MMLSEAELISRDRMVTRIAELKGALREVLECTACGGRGVVGVPILEEDVPPADCDCRVKAYAVLAKDCKRLHWERLHLMIDMEKEKGLVRVAAGLSEYGFTELTWAVVWNQGQYINPSKDGSKNGLFASSYNVPMAMLFYQDDGGHTSSKIMDCFLPCPSITPEALRCPDWWGAESEMAGHG
jgi:hypothetical protein